MPNPTLWPFQPNSSGETVELYGYPTRVLTALSGREQRIQQGGGHATGAWEGDYLLALEQESSLLASIIHRYQAEAPLAIPIWPYVKPLQIARSPGDTILTVDTTDVPHRDAVGFGGYVAIWSSPFTWEVCAVSDVGAGTLTVGPLTKTWGTAGVYVLPCRLGRMDDVQPYQWITNLALAARVRFELQAQPFPVTVSAGGEFIIFGDQIIPAA